MGPRLYSVQAQFSVVGDCADTHLVPARNLGDGQ